MASRTLRRVWVVALLVAGCGHMHDIDHPLKARDYTVDPSIQYTKVRLSDIASSPSQGMYVTFMAIFDLRDEKIWQPFFTAIGPDEYVSFSVWPPESRIWEMEGRQSSIPTLFMQKQSPSFSELGLVHRYDMVEIRGVVQSTWGERPWVVVHRILKRGEGPAYDDDSIRRLIYGLDDVERAPASAIKNLDIAVHGRLAPAARALAHRTLGRLYEKRTELNPEFWTKALEHYQAALKLNPNDRESLEGADRAALQIDLLRRAAEMRENQPEPQPEPPKPEEPKPEEPKPEEPKQP